MTEYPRERLVSEGNTAVCDACWDSDQIVTWWPDLYAALKHVDIAHDANPDAAIRVFVPAGEAFSIDE